MTREASILVADDPLPAPITITLSPDRRSRTDQIQEVLGRAREKNEPVRVRLPLALYDYGETRGYTYLRDAAWNLQLPCAHTTPETIEDLIEILGQCVVAIAREGSATVRAKLEQPLPETPA